MSIIIERTITVKNDKATLDNPLYLYVGDGDITYLFTIKEMKKSAFFGKIDASNSLTDDKSYGEVRIYKPTDELVFSTRAEIIDDKLQVLFSYENVDQLTEAGVHQLQIHLYDDESDERNRFTIPPIELNVLFPVGTSTSAVDYAVAGYAEARQEDPIDTFNEDGSYNKTEWTTGDKITSGKLNKIEDAIYEINNANDTYATKDELQEAIGDIDFDEYVTEDELSAMSYVSSTAVTRIEIVNELPEVEEDGVLYIVKAEE